MTQRAAASLYRGISSEVALLRHPGRATTPATGRTRVNARFTALDRVQGRSETRDQSQKRPHRTLTSATATNPSFSRIGRDMAPACTVSAGVRRATADALRAERDFWRRQFLLGLAQKSPPSWSCREGSQLLGRDAAKQARGRAVNPCTRPLAERHQDAPQLVISAPRALAWGVDFPR